MAEPTPLMKQYLELKSQVPDSLLLFRMGDFYELFGEDAVEASKILEITLTSRDKNKENPLPMAGVPWHSVQGYIQRLLKAGKKVAIGEQLEPEAGEKIVRREIVRQLTPGIQFDLEGSEANYLAVILTDGKQWTLACLDASTGECLTADSLSDEALARDLESLPIRHLLRMGDTISENDSLRTAFSSFEASSALVETLPSNYLSSSQAQEILKRHYEVQHLDAFSGSASVTLALGVLVAYALRTQQRETLPHVRPPVPLHRSQCLALGPRTAQHLDLLPVASDATPNLFNFINRTRSALGSRQLRRWLLTPLKDPASIRMRQDAVRELSGHSCKQAENLSRAMSEVYDLERILGRINTGLANPRDTLALGKSLGVLTHLENSLAQSRSALLLSGRETLARLGKELHVLAERILSTQREDAPLSTRDGGIFKLGTNAELDRLLNIGEDGQKWMIDLETRERERTGIPSLKVRYNRVFGYYIEVTQAHLKNVPSSYQRKQTTVGAERFFTEELKKFEEEIVNASSRQQRLEQELFTALVTAIREKTSLVMEAAGVLGELDSLASLAQLTMESGWVFPEIDSSLSLEITQGRHPLVDAASRGAFVPNDFSLSPETRLTLMITGPNMGGKSTIMRQTALIVLMGQMGAPVPAKSARWGAVSALYTRIGAHDAIARGQSTFMVEMSELAHILHHADERSLIVLDEIGRGTSTYDGISVAWATLEHICGKIRARTLFATHYHELTRLASSIPKLDNAHMAVESEKGSATGASSRNSADVHFRFLYLLKEGPANESFGIHVARLAGIPKPVVARAWKVLEELEQGSRVSAHAPGQLEAAGQLSLFAAAATEPAPAEPHPVLTELERLDPNHLTPLEALNWLARITELNRETTREKSRESGSKSS